MRPNTTSEFPCYVVKPHTIHHTTTSSVTSAQVLYVSAQISQFHWWMSWMFRTSRLWEPVQRYCFHITDGAASNSSTTESLRPTKDKINHNLCMTDSVHQVWLMKTKTSKLTCWGPSPLTMAWGGGEARSGSSELRSWPDSRGGVWSAMSPSFTPLKRYSCNKHTAISGNVQSLPQRSVVSSCWVIQSAIRPVLKTTFIQNVQRAQLLSTHLIITYICTTLDVTAFNMKGQNRTVCNFINYVWHTHLATLHAGGLKPILILNVYTYNYNNSYNNI